MGFGSSKSQSNNQSQQTSSSLNQAYPTLSNALTPQLANVGAGTSALSALLGLNGSSAQSDGFDAFRKSSGYDFTRDQGVQGINTSMASKGLLNSGSALKAITGYSSNLANNFLGTYMQNLLGLSNTGIQAGQILSSAGNTANSQGTSYGTSTGKSTNLSLG